MDPVDWDKRYLQMAQLVATWSKDDTKVGAVIVRNNRVIATGFNGLPKEVRDTNKRLKNNELKLAMTVHAEENALIVAGRAAEGAELYVYGKPVCSRCAGSIIQAGIGRVVAMSPNSEKLDSNSKWHPVGILACEMFGESRTLFWDRELETSEEISIPDPSKIDKSEIVPFSAARKKTVAAKSTTKKSVAKKPGRKRT